MTNNLERFIKIQKEYYEIALTEIKNGKKVSHWCWFIFPQIEGIGHSTISQYYAIKNLTEAKEYLDTPYLYDNLINICKELLKLKSNNILEIMGFPDNLKLCSSMTLFSIARPSERIFNEVLEKYYNGIKDSRTLEILKIKEES